MLKGCKRQWAYEIEVTHHFKLAVCFQHYEEILEGKK